MDEDDVEDAIQRLTFDDLQTFGNGLGVFGDGQALTPGMFDSQFIGAEAQVVSGPPKPSCEQPTRAARTRSSRSRPGTGWSA